MAGLEVVAAARWSGLRHMCSLRASMEASLTRAVRSAPLKKRERERDIIIMDTHRSQLVESIKYCTPASTTGLIGLQKVNN